MSHRVFLLSPARCSGKRAELILNHEATFELARRLRTKPGAPLGEVFSFLSGLYFRGKLAYSHAFARPPRGIGRALVITPNRGLISADEHVTLADLRAFASVPIDLGEPRYVEPLLAGAARIAAELSRSSRVILLGSIATPKYCEPLLSVFATRLHFPAAFAGRGDMSRGGLLLRAVDAGSELDYVPLASGVRRGTRPPKLPPRSRPSLSGAST